MAEPAQNIQRATDEILSFWFGLPGSAEHGRVRAAWFRKDPAFDEAVRQQFSALHQQAAAGSPEAWRANERACLAYIVLLDQMSRNMFRDTPRAFAFDPQALAMARHAVGTELDKRLMPVERMFVYLPFEHSENLADQVRSVELFDSLREAPELADTIPYARRHYDIIARFGRFPHRNRILGRASTAEELEYLSQPGARF